MPAGLVEQNDGVKAGLDLGADFLEVRGHRLAVTVWHDKTGCRSLVRADRSEDVRPLGPLILGGGRAGSASGPATGQFVFLPNPRLILEPNFQLCSLRKLGLDFLDPEGGNLF